jgi:hypothetical protein
LSPLGSFKPSPVLVLLKPVTGVVALVPSNGVGGGGGGTVKVIVPVPTVVKLSIVCPGTVVVSSVGVIPVVV